MAALTDKRIKYDNNTMRLTPTNKTDTASLARLQRLYGYLAALADHYGNRGIFRKISEIFDCTGTLIVSWDQEPTAGELEFFDKAWAGQIAGDAPAQIEHLVMPPCTATRPAPAGKQLGHKRQAKQIKPGFPSKTTSKNGRKQAQERFSRRPWYDCAPHFRG